MKLVILGTPRTKKNSPRLFKNRRTGKPVFAQSEASTAWTKAAVLQLRSQWIAQALSTPVRVGAVVYRKTRVGDLINYLAAIHDALQAAGVVQDDKLIVNVDGSRLALDKINPRVEIEIEALAAMGLVDWRDTTDTDGGIL